MIALNLCPDPEDLAGLALLLASVASDRVSGALLVIRGVVPFDR